MLGEPRDRRGLLPRKGEVQYEFREIVQQTRLILIMINCIKAFFGPEKDMETCPLTSTDSSTVV